MYSDSSSDSDSGIRFKTTTTRQIEDKHTSDRNSPRCSQRPNNPYERRNDRFKGHDKYRRDERSDDRRPRKYDDRKSSPGHNYRRKESTRTDKSHHRDRDRDRSRSRQDNKRFRSPLNKNGSRRRSTSDDRKHGRREGDDVKSSSSVDTKLLKDVSSKYNERNRIEDSPNTKTNSIRSSSKDNNNKSHNKSSVGKNINEKFEKTEHSANGQQVNISSTRKKYVQELSKSSNYVLKDRKEIKKDPEKIDHKLDEKPITIMKYLQKDPTLTDKQLLVEKTKDEHIVVNIKDDDYSESLAHEANRIKSKSDEEKVTKNKTKKLKHSKHVKKHKKEKIDLSEGELTPSDNDISFNDSELDKTASSEKTIKISDTNASCRRPIGPEIPKELRGELEHASTEVIEISDSGRVSSDDDTYGPLPSSSSKITKAHLELEERAIKIRMDKLQEIDVKDEKNRDEWMLELPDVQAAHLGLGPRKFRAREGPDMTDRSSWTDTPLTKSGKSKTETEPQASKRIAEEAHRLRIQEKDAKQEKLIKKHKKKHKREESLLDMHQKKLRKKKKKEKGDGLTTERRRFDRDTDLGVNRFDEAQKKSIFKKAQLLDTRFSQGESKFL